ncbi:GH25 family lysozyme [Streptomyces sp. x-80]|uniref:GH25 family lysozyme n=1 Tax=Streptomyces sp. x-80 TaxID=2789282 RepID=UPI00397EF2FB
MSCAQKDAFLAEVKRLRGSTHRVGLYCNLDYWKNRDHTSNAGDALWIADYVTAGRPRITAQWLFHQHTDRPLDTNVGQFADRAALWKWASGGAGTPPGGGTGRPTVSLAHVVAAARTDPPAAEGHITYRDEVLRVEQALAAEGLLASTYVDGSFGAKTVAAFAALQRRYGYSGRDADGIPGVTSLTRLGTAHGFTTTS